MDSPLWDLIFLIFQGGDFIYLTGFLGEVKEMMHARCLGTLKWQLIF